MRTEILIYIYSLCLSEEVEGSERWQECSQTALHGRSVCEDQTNNPAQETINIF